MAPSPSWEICTSCRTSLLKPYIFEETEVAESAAVRALPIIALQRDSMTECIPIARTSSSRLKVLAANLHASLVSSDAFSPVPC